MSKGPINPFASKPRPPEPERAIEPAHSPTPPRSYQPQRLAETPAIKTILGQGCVVEGKLVCAGPTQLDGKISGELIADDFLLIDRNATILADLDVQEVVVRGAVKGNIRAARRVTLEETAQVEGDVAAPAVEMKIGAQMSGKIDVIHRAQSAQPPQGAIAQPSYQALGRQATPAYQQQPAPQPATAAREPAQTFVAFDDGVDRSGF